MLDEGLYSIECRFNSFLAAVHLGSFQPFPFSTNPWIADAAVLKLYPDRLQIAITERRAFALWQRNGRVSVIADDGTVLQPFMEPRYRGLPLVVGRGAERQAKDFIGLIDRYPEIRSALRASVLVAERRWNLRLTNGLDVRLPETAGGQGPHQSQGQHGRYPRQRRLEVAERAGDRRPIPGAGAGGTSQPDQASRPHGIAGRGSDDAD